MKLKVLKKQNNSDMCAVCGFKNDFSLKSDFYETEGKYVVSITNGQDDHQSYPNRMHGGLISALLDETIGRAIQIDEPNSWGVTGELKIKFRKPTPLNKSIYCVGYITKQLGKIFVGSGFIEDENGELLAEAVGTYVKIPLEKIIDDDSSAIEWKLINVERTPEYIEIKNLNDEK